MLDRWIDMLTNNTLLLLGRLVVEQFEGVEAALLGCEFERTDQLAYRLADVIPLNWAEDQAKHQEEVANYIDQLEQKDIEIEGLEDEKQDLEDQIPDDYAADLKDLLKEVQRTEMDISSAAGEIESRIAELERSLEERISQLTRRVR